MRGKTWRESRLARPITIKLTTFTRAATITCHLKSVIAATMDAIENTRPKIVNSTKSICNLFFGSRPFDEVQKRWKCKCGNVRKCDIMKHGYANLFTHIKLKHPDYQSLIKTYSTESVNTPSQLIRQPQSSLEFLVDTKSNDIFKWLDWIVMDELELSFCEKPRTRGNARLTKICTKSLKKYMFKVVTSVKKKIVAIAAACPRYALIFDGWTEDNTHFIGK